MKKVKQIIFLCVFVFLITLLQGCPSPITSSRHPTSQPGTTWSTDDGKVTFCVDSSDTLSPVCGVVKTEDGDVEIVVSMSTNISFVEISFGDAYKAQKDDQPVVSFAHGQGKTNSKDEFVIEIASAECFFETGEMLVFHKRIDESFVS